MYMYNFTKSSVSIDAIEQEIGDEGFSQAINGSGWNESDGSLTLCFEAQLTEGEEATLNAVVVNHTAPSGKPGETCLLLKDGVDEPAALTDGAQLYVDGVTGNLMVKFGDGHTVTIAVDE